MGSIYSYPLFHLNTSISFYVAPNHNGMHENLCRNLVLSYSGFIGSNVFWGGFCKSKVNVTVTTSVCVVTLYGCYSTSSFRDRGGGGDYISLFVKSGFAPFPQNGLILYSKPSVLFDWIHVLNVCLFFVVLCNSIHVWWRVLPQTLGSADTELIVVALCAMFTPVFACVMYESGEILMQHATFSGTWRHTSRRQQFFGS